MFLRLMNFLEQDRCLCTNRVLSEDPANNLAFRARSLQPARISEDWEIFGLFSPVTKKELSCSHEAGVSTLSPSAETEAHAEEGNFTPFPIS